VRMLTNDLGPALAGPAFVPWHARSRSMSSPSRMNVFDSTDQYCGSVDRSKGPMKHIGGGYGAGPATSRVNDRVTSKGLKSRLETIGGDARRARVAQLHKSQLHDEKYEIARWQHRTAARSTLLQSEACHRFGGSFIFCGINQSADATLDRLRYLLANIDNNEQGGKHDRVV